jgi:hypothetical protein
LSKSKSAIGCELALLRWIWYSRPMSTLAEIENASEQLTAEEKQDLILFLATRLQAGKDLPSPRQYTKEEVQEWIARDEAGWERVRSKL